VPCHFVRYRIPSIRRRGLIDRAASDLFAEILPKYTAIAHEIGRARWHHIAVEPAKFIMQRGCRPVFVEGFGEMVHSPLVQIAQFAVPGGRCYRGSQCAWWGRSQIYYFLKGCTARPLPYLRYSGNDYVAELIHCLLKAIVASKWRRRFYSQSSAPGCGINSNQGNAITKHDLQ
jgi:hypothetical protein